jgi:hypothetical protein
MKANASLVFKVLDRSILGGGMLCVRYRGEQDWVPLQLAGLPRSRGVQACIEWALARWEEIFPGAKLLKPEVVFTNGAEAELRATVRADELINRFRQGAHRVQSWDFR